jgi:hypothetical protein
MTVARRKRARLGEQPLAASGVAECGHRPQQIAQAHQRVVAQTPELRVKSPDAARPFLCSFGRRQGQCCCEWPINPNFWRRATKLTLGVLRRRVLRNPSSGRAKQMYSRASDSSLPARA